MLVAQRVFDSTATCYMLQVTVLLNDRTMQLHERYPKTILDLSRVRGDELPDFGNPHFFFGGHDKFPDEPDYGTALQLMNTSSLQWHTFHSDAHRTRIASKVSSPSPA